MRFLLPTPLYSATSSHLFSSGAIAATKVCNFTVEIFRLEQWELWSRESHLPPSRSVFCYTLSLGRRYNLALYLIWEVSTGGWQNRLGYWAWSLGFNRNPWIRYRCWCWLHVMLVYRQSLYSTIVWKVKTFSFFCRCRKVLNMRLFTNESTGRGWDQNVSSVNKICLFLFKSLFAIGFIQSLGMCYAGNAEGLWSFTW